MDEIGALQKKVALPELIEGWFRPTVVKLGDSD